MKRFKLSTEVLFSEDAIDALLEEKDENAVLITDKFMVDSGMADMILKKLSNCKEVSVFSEVVPDPPMDLIERGIAFLQDKDCDIVVALGGGSSIDAAKAIVYMAKKIEEMGADSICIKDMAGLLVPYKAAELIKAMKENTKLPIQLHTHYTSGVASMTYLKAVEAGVDVIDCAISPFALGTSQPATEVMVETFKGTPYDTGYDQNLLAEIADYFRPYREQCLESGLMSTKVLGVNIKTLLYQVPGGMLSNMVSQLKEQHAEDKYQDVLEEIPRVRKDCGEPPLVTPSSQIVGTQAVFNVLMGERYKMATGEFKDLLRGKYGQTVKPMNQEVIDKVIPGEQRFTSRSADAAGLTNEMDKLESEMKEWKQQDEDVLSYALFPQVATDFFKYRQAQQEKVDLTQADTKNAAYPV